MNNLLRGASILLTPAAYSNGSLYCIKPNTPTGDFSFIRATTATKVNSRGLIESIASGFPRIDFLGGTGQILLEPASTNTATYSNDFMNERLDIFNGSSKPTLLNAVLTENQGTSPDGENNAFLLKDNNDGETGQISLNYYTSVVNFNDFNTFSVFVKKSLSNDFIILSTGGFDSDANGTTWFNINNGSLGTISTNHTAKIKDYGNGWYRCSITNKITTDQQGAFRIILATANNQVWSTRNGTSGVLLFGLQAEAHALRSFATSYIPTSGATVTRNTEEVNNSGDASLINSTEGVLYAEISVLNVDATVRSITISDSSIANYVEIIYLTNGDFGFRIRENNVVKYSQTSPLTDATQFVKAAISYKSGDIKCFINGSEFDTNISTFSFTNPLSELAFNRGNSEGDFFGKVKCVAVFKEILTDAQLISLTS